MKEYYSVPVERLAQAKCIIQGYGSSIRVIGRGIPVGGGPRTAEFDVTGHDPSNLDERVLQEWRSIGVKPIKKISVTLRYRGAIIRAIELPYGMDIQTLCQTLEIDGLAEFQGVTSSGSVVGDYATSGQVKEGGVYTILNFLRGDRGLRKLKAISVINRV